MVLRIYWASVSGNRKVNSDQARLKNIIQCLKLESEWVDITVDTRIKEQMRKECGNSTAMPPQIFNEQLYLGTVDDLNDSVEGEYVWEWLKMKNPKTSNKTDDKVDQPNETLNENSSQMKETETSIVKTMTLKSNLPMVNKIADEHSSLKLTKSVSSVISTFENPKPKENGDNKREVNRITISNDNNNSNNSHTVVVDEERKRRLLGLPPLDSNVLSDKTNGKNGPIKEQIVSSDCENDIKTFAITNSEKATLNGER